MTTILPPRVLRIRDSQNTPRTANGSNTSSALLMIPPHAVAFPIALGTAGVASADTGYDSGSSSAGPDGAGTSQVSAGTTGQGSSVGQSSGWADTDGASQEAAQSHAGQNGTGYEHNSHSAGADGAHSSHTGAHAGGNTDTDNGQGQGGVLSGIGL